MTAGYPDAVPVLGDGVVTLRAHRLSDVSAIVEQSRDAGSLAWTRVPDDYQPEQAYDFLEHIRAQWEDPQGDRLWAIEAADGTGASAFAGTVDLRRRGDALWEIGFGLHPWARGRGLMARAVRLACRHALEELDGESVRWQAQVGNWASRRVAWACGFRHDGSVRDLLPRRGGGRVDGWLATLRRGEPLEPVTPWLDIPVLVGRTVRLRPWRAADRPEPDRPPDPASDLFVPGFLPTADGYDSWLLGRQERAAQGEAVTWCVADLSTDMPLGGIACFRLNLPLLAGSGQVAYWLEPAERGHRRLDEALALLADHAFAPVEAGGLGLHRLAAGTDMDNRASSRLLLRNGYRVAGVERRAMARPDGEHVDGPLFDLLAAERDQQPVRPLTVPIVQLRGVRLRPWRDGDRPAADWSPDEQSRRFLPAGAQPTHDAFAEWLRLRRWRTDTGVALLWAIADVESDRVLGSVTLHHIDREDGSAELGYWLYPEARGRGIADQAISFAVGHAFGAVAEGGLGLRRLRAVTVAANRASARALLRAGFRAAGLERDVFAEASPRDARVARDATGAHAGVAAADADGERDQAVFEILARDDRSARASAYRSSRIEPRNLDVAGAAVRLRAFRAADVPRIVEGCSDRRTQKFLDRLPSPYGEAEAWSFLARIREEADGGQDVHWCVTDAATDVLLGSIGLHRLGHGRRDTAEVGFWAHPDARGRGVMTAACRAVVRHALLPRDEGGLGRRRVTLRARADNTASRHVAERAGMRLAGVARAAAASRSGRVYDLAWYDALAEDVLPRLP